MKIAIVNSEDVRGGAARAAFRLYRALKMAGHEVDYIVMHNRSGNPEFKSVSGFDYWKAMQWRKLAKLRSFFTSRRHPNLSFPASFDSGLVKLINDDYDVVHLHWINDAFINPESLLKIKKPIVWTLHDMWPFTGGCHYAFNCENYKGECGNCPIIKEDGGVDITGKIWARKKKVYDQLNLKIVTPSRWMGACAEASSLFKGKQVKVIPNTIDEHKFKPMDKAECRTELNLPQDKKLLLFGAINSTTDKRKGYAFLEEAMQNLAKDTDEVEVVIVGNSGRFKKQVNGLTTHGMGNISDDETLIKIYNACDALVVPSLQDNLPNMIMEAMACGLPCVGFSTGGIPDMIEHYGNGFLVHELNGYSLFLGIKSVLFSDNAKSLSDYARNHVIKKYNADAVVKSHVNLYNELIGTK